MNWALYEIPSFNYSFFLHYINTWGQKGQNSVFYEAFLPMTWIKPSTGVAKYGKCMGSHVARDITIPRTVRMDIRNASWGEGDYMLVFNTLYFLAGSTQCWTHVCVCVQAPWSYKFWFWIKILIIWAAVSSNDLKRATMSLDVYFISFFLFCHQTGQYIAQINAKGLVTVNQYFNLHFLCDILVHSGRVK